MEKFKDYYKILGIDRSASDEEIKKAYRELVKKYHPDKNPPEMQEAASEKFKEVQEAFEALGGKRKERRAEYDARYDAYQQRKRQSRTAGATSGSGFGTHSSDFGNQRSRNRSTGTHQSNNTNRNYQSAESKKEDTRGSFRRAWDEVREDEREYPFTERHARIDRRQLKKDRERRTASRIYEDKYGNVYSRNYVRKRTVPETIAFQFKRGTVHIASELVYQLAKLAYITEDTVPKFVLRNRNLVAGALAATLIFGSIGTNQSQPVVDNQSVSAQTTISEDDMAYGEEVIIDAAEREEAAKVNQAYTVYRTYEIGYGDTLSVLAERANCSVSEITRENNISNSSMIQAGTEIVIPYHIESGDLRYATYSAYYTPGTPLSEFAAQYDTTVESIKRLNSEAIEDGEVISDTLLVPNFATPKEIKEEKEAASTKTYTYSNNE